MEQNFSYVKCSKCPEFDSPECKTFCIWSIEYNLIKKYGSLEKATEAMRKEYEEAKSKVKSQYTLF